MSFGVFLLNQIHNLIGQTTSTEGVEGRELRMVPSEGTDLQILFNPPTLDNTGENQRKTGTVETKSSGRNSMGSSSSGSTANNMFRAMLNLLNAYTKDSQALECIWAIYCEDLDKTSANEGLYGIAARINR